MRALRYTGYVVWFLATFVIGLYLTFPVDELKGLLVTTLEDQMGKGKQGPYGTDPKVTLGQLSLSGFGLKAERVQLQLGSRDPDPGPVVDLDELAFSIRPWSVLTKAKTVSVDADLYGGSVDAVVTVDEKGSVHDADIDIDDVDLGKVPLVVQKLGVPVSGKLNLSASLDLGPTPEKDGEGNVKLDVTGLSVGPGALKLAFGFELPTIDLGNLRGEIPVKQGKGSLTGVKLDGKDIQAELVGDITFKGKLASSRLDIDGWFQPMPAFLEREKKFQSLLELGESFNSGGVSLSKAKDEDGHYWFAVKGTLQSAQPTLSRDAGKRAKAKATKGSSSPPPAKEKEPAG